MMTQTQTKPSKWKAMLATACAFLIAFVHPVEAQERSKHLAFVGDLNASSPARDSAGLGALSAEMDRHVAAQNLRYLDHVTIRTSGDASAKSHRDQAWNRSIKLAHGGARPRDVSGFLKGRVKALGQMPAQSGNELIWALSELSRDLDCAAQDTTVYIISNVVDGGAVVDGFYEYASFDGTPFADCREAVFVGFGAQHEGDPSVVKAARSLLGNIMRAAGFETITFL